MAQHAMIPESLFTANREILVMECVCSCMHVVSRPDVQDLMRTACDIACTYQLFLVERRAQGTIKGCRHALGLLGAVTFVIVNSVSPNLN